MLSLRSRPNLWAAAVLAAGLAVGIDRAEAASVTINVTSFGAGEAADITGARAAQNLFHGAGPTITEDFEGFLTGSVASLDTAIGTFSALGPVGTGTADLETSEHAQIRDGSFEHGGETITQHNGGRYNTTSGGANYLDSNDNGGIRLEIPGTSGVGSFNMLSLLATDIDDVGSAGFSIGELGGSVPLFESIAGSLGTPANGTLHLITFLFSESISNIGIDFMIDPGDGFSIDDVAISTVPLPAAGWLLLSALAGLGLLGRRRSAVA